MNKKENGKIIKKMKKINKNQIEKKSLDSNTPNEKKRIFRRN